MYLQKNKKRLIFTMVCLVSYLLLAPFMFTSCSMFQNKEEQRIEKQDKTFKDYAKTTLSIVLTIVMIAWPFIVIFSEDLVAITWMFGFLEFQGLVKALLIIIPELILLFLRIKVFHL